MSALLEVHGAYKHFGGVAAVADAISLCRKS